MYQDTDVQVSDGTRVKVELEIAPTVLERNSVVYRYGVQKHANEVGVVKMEPDSDNEHMSGEQKCFNEYVKEEKCSNEYLNKEKKSSGKMAQNLGTGEDPPDEFFEALHDKDDDYGMLLESDEEMVEEEWLDEDEHKASIVRSRSPSRSRSPLPALRKHHQDFASTVVVYNTMGDKVDVNESTDGAALLNAEFVTGDDMVVEENVFWVPDAHALFGNVDESMNDKATNDPLASAETNTEIVKGCRSRGNVSMRGRGRGQMSARGRRMGPLAAPRKRLPRGGCDDDVGFIRGDPINVVYIHDEDVPEELRKKVLEVVGKRAERARKAKAKRDAKIEISAKLRERVSKSDDVFFDALDGSIIDMDLDFKWSSMNTYECREETFLLQHTGAVHGHDTPYSAFRGYWDDEILGHIVTETNRYAESHPKREWYPTNTHEILVLFAFWMMLGIIRMPSITSCFTVHPLLKVDIFRKLFTQKRYHNLVRYLHFVDISNRGDTTAAASDRLFKLRPLLEHLNRKFKEAYVPDKDICVDESLTLWKGVSAIRQFIRTKAARFGIKTLELCESATGYLWSFLVYTGKQDSLEFEDSSLLKNTSVVIELMKPLLHRGHRLFMDTWYNSPVLARFLKRNGTDCVGTLAPARAYVPPMVTMVPLKKGELTARHSGDVCVMAWQDHKRVTTLSTCHGIATGWSTVPSREPTRPLQFKPQVVLDHSRSMGGVDLKDQMLEPYLIERKRCAKWYMKLFKRLLNCSIHNARILVKSSTKKHQDHLAFRLRLVHEILEQHLLLTPQRPTMRRRADAGPGRLVPTTHWPVRIDPIQCYIQRNMKSQIRCSLCYSEGRKSTKTQYKCEICNTPLCIDPCFKSYHLSSKSLTSM